jgi:hypothetical protein
MVVDKRQPLFADEVGKARHQLTIRGWGDWSWDLLSNKLADDAVDAVGSGHDLAAEGSAVCGGDDGPVL